MQFFIMPEVFYRVSSVLFAFVSGFPLKDCGNDRLKLNLFMQHKDYLLINDEF